MRGAPDENAAGGTRSGPAPAPDAVVAADRNGLGMGGEWEVARLGDVTDLLSGYPFSSACYTEDPHAPRLLRGDNVVQGTLRWDGVKRWPSDSVGDLSAFELREGDVVLAMDRPWIEAGLKHASVRADDLPALLVQRVSRLRGMDKLDTGFLKYLIGSQGFTDYVLGVQTGTAVPHISGGQIRDFQFRMPPLPEQRAIAHILGTLDDKIELNRRVNETLEAMARALFKSWFVDFDPVRAKMQGRWCRGESLPGLPAHLYDLFPDRLVDSELGEIPEGWELGRFGDVVLQSRDQMNPLDEPDTVFSHYSIPAFDEGQRPKAEMGESIKSLKSRVPSGAILVSKLNPEIERVWFVDIVPTERAVCSTEFLVLAPRSPYGRSFVYCLNRSPLLREQITALATGTSGSHQRAQVGSIMVLDVLLPPEPVALAFEHAVTPLLDRTLECRSESRALASVRDTLLPKLISGELRVDDLDRFAEWMSSVCVRRSRTGRVINSGVRTGYPWRER